MVVAVVAVDRIWEIGERKREVGCGDGVNFTTEEVFCSENALRSGLSGTEVEASKV